MDENIDPIIYLYIIENYKPQEWKYEFLLLQLEERLVDGVFSKIIIKPTPYDRLQLRQHLKGISDQIFYLLWHRVVDFDLSTFVPEKLQETFKFIKMKQNELEREDFQRLGRLHLNDWLGDLKCRTWEIEIKKNFELMTDGDAREFVSTLLKLEREKGEKFCRDCIDKWKGLSILDWFPLKLELNQHLHGASTAGGNELALSQ